MLKLASRSHIGLVRSLNEDSVAAFEGPPWLLLVADGMGGHSAGEVASAMACEIVSSALREGDCSASHLSAAVEAANGAIYERSRTVEGCRGMGTTLVFACGTGKDAVVANIGDSRAYHYSRSANALRQITRDHSLVQELMSAGRMTRAQAAVYPYKNVITRAVGTAPAVSADFFEVELSDGDAILLCSDGLTNEVPENRIRDVFKKAKTPEEACDALIRHALNGGGKDNISVAVAYFSAEGGGVK